MFDPSLETLAVLALVAFVAGIVDAIAGGGGLINVPALLLAGADPVTAVATNKLQGTFGVASSTVAYARAGMIARTDVLTLFPAAVAGGMLGALAVQAVPSEPLRILMPLLLVAVALYFAFGRRIGAEGRPPRMGRLGYGLVAGLPIGAYDGFFGPGGGTFFMLSLMALLGMKLMDAVGRTKLLNFGSNAGALAVFLLGSAVQIKVGLVMGVASAAGSQIGARLAIRDGARIIRPLVVIVSIGMALRLILDPAHPLWSLF